MLRLSQGASLAAFSFVANRLLEQQVRTAHAWGEFLRDQSTTLGDFAERSGDPALGDALAMLAGIAAHAGDAVVEAAVEWGRRHGHLAFAVPVAPCAGG